MNDLASSRRVLYLGGLPVRPPPPPQPLLDHARAVAAALAKSGTATPSTAFRALLDEARRNIPDNLTTDPTTRGRLAAYWAAEAVRGLAFSGHLSGDLSAVDAHLHEQGNPRAAVMGLLTIAPNLSTHALAEMTGASPMTVGRARADLAEKAE